MTKNTILIVDDNHKNLQILANIIKNDEVDIHVMKSGEKAIEVAKKILPDLVLLDIMMPEMDGFEVCDILKNDAVTKNIPIIFITAKTATEDIVRGFELGAVDYITKPVNEKEVIARVGTHLSLKRHRDQLEDIVRERTAELEKERFKAEAANRAKSSFLKNIQHELVTPMNGIIGFNELMLETGLDEELKEYAEMISTSANTLHMIITDILYLTQIENGALQLQKIEFNLKNTLMDACNAFSISAREKALELTCVLSDDIPESVLGDPDRIEQIFQDLISNAIKFTDKGEVNITVGLKEKTKKHVVLACAVSDTGIGIEKGKIDHLLIPFSQLDESLTRNHGGLGLGLTIARHLIEMMDGELTVDSTVGKGTTFYFTVKLSLIRQAGSSIG